MDARLGFLLLFLCGSVFGQAFDQSHKVWDALLKKNVLVLQGGRASQFRYAEMAREKGALKAYLQNLSKVRQEEFNSWSRPQRMAFLINAYNAFTVELIVDNYPVKSIKDIGGVFDNRWKRKFFSLLGHPSYLDQIEHEMLRKPGAYGEPRVHFAVNCASIGCPMLREEAYVADRLEAQLAQQAERFLSDRSRNRAVGGKLEVSKIFDWFKEDFGQRELWFAKYAKLLSDDPAQQKLVAEGKASLSFLDYDWSLNDAK